MDRITRYQQQKIIDTKPVTFHSLPSSQTPRVFYRVLLVPSLVKRLKRSSLLRNQFLAFYLASSYYAYSYFDCYYDGTTFIFVTPYSESFSHSQTRFCAHQQPTLVFAPSARGLWLITNSFVDKKFNFNSKKSKQCLLTSSDFGVLQRDGNFEKYPFHSFPYGGDFFFNEVSLLLLIAIKTFFVPSLKHRHHYEELYSMSLFDDSLKFPHPFVTLIKTIRDSPQNQTLWKQLQTSFTSKNDIKIFANFQFTFNFDKLSFSQILFLSFLRSLLNVFKLSPAHIKKYEKKLTHLFCQLPVTHYTNDFSYDCDVSLFQLFQEHFTSIDPQQAIFVLVSLACSWVYYLTDDMDKTSLLYDTLYLSCQNGEEEDYEDDEEYYEEDYGEEFNFDFFFHLIHLVNTDRSCLQLQKIHDRLVDKVNQQERQVAINNFKTLNTNLALLKNHQGVIFEPIVDSVALFDFGKQMHNCVYCRRHEKHALFYRVIKDGACYCLQINQHKNRFEIFEIKGVCNEVVEDEELLANINQQLQAFRCS